ncbi:MAG: hypothetical protein PGN08_06920, partial [Sphingomonas taxi]
MPATAPPPSSAAPTSTGRWSTSPAAAGSRPRGARHWPIPDRSRAAEGALYDDLGRPDAEPHLVRGQGSATDPQFFATAVDGIADVTPEDGWPLP